jgi:hypothetical protein
MITAAPAVTPEIEALAAQLSALVGFAIPAAVAIQAGKALAAQLDAEGHAAAAERLACVISYAVNPSAFADLVAAEVGA